MLQIFTHTPIWVWLLLIVLCVLGFHQTKTRQVSMQRVFILPCIMLLLALHSMYKGFGSNTLALVIWGITTCLICLMIVLRSVPSQHRYDDATQRFIIAGSWQPLVLMLGMFIAKYSMNVGLAIQPELAQQYPFALGFSFVFGIFNGVFLARPLTLLTVKNQGSYSRAEMTV